MYEDIEKAVMMRARAKMMETEADLLKQEANDILGAMMPVYHMKDYTLENVGKVTMKDNKGSSINKKKLTENLVLRGVEPDDVNDIIGKSSTTWARTVIQFDLPK